VRFLSAIGALHIRARYCESVLVVGAGLLGPIAYFVPRALPILCVVMAAAGLVLRLRQGPSVQSSLLAACLPALPLLGVALLSAIWSITPGTSLARALRLGIEFGIAGLFLVTIGAIARPLAHRLLRAAVIGLAIAAPLAILDLALSGALTVWARASGSIGLHVAYSRGAVLHALIACPLAIYWWRAGDLRFAMLALGTGVAVWPLGQLAAQLGLLSGLAAGLVVRALPALRYLLLALPVLILAVTPSVIPIQLGPELCRTLAIKPSALHRLEIWGFASTRWSEKPLLGWGIETSRAVPGGQDFDPIALPCGTDASGPRTQGGYAMPLHPHNFAVQVWLELGAAGALAAAFLVAVIGKRALRSTRDRWGQAALAGFWIPATFVASVSFGIWQGWWLAALVLAGAIARLAWVGPPDANQGHIGSGLPPRHGP
jgi:O-antigen ligase